jgi:DNA repair exonuclease SbcCD ATPase subunit
MVKKEQIQKELEMLKQDNKALQKTIGELNAEIVELKKELEDAKKAAEEAKTADANSDGPDGQDGRDGRAGTEAETRDPETGAVDELKGKIGILLGAIAASCKDHCPHHLDENACRNCSIYKSVFNAGFEMPKEIKNEE